MTNKQPKRGRKPLPDNERKDQLVQTRVPTELSETLREAAKQNRVTVSQLIRNVLEDTFDLVDNVVAETVSLGQTVRRDALRIAESAKGQRPRQPRPGRTAATIVAIDAWQEVLLNRDVTCVRCGDEIPRGSKAMFGLSDGPDAPKVWLCLPCSKRI
jgi:hypothetical protein